MSTPIPVTFCRELPSRSGEYLQRFAPGWQIRLLSIRRPHSTQELIDVDSGDTVGTIGGEWAGPLTFEGDTPATNE